ncbi:DEAD/DEAH box helicase [Gaoshiqia sediminis]|uniref:DEAD/DEAH box helicase n=1 Tax=Gaoshiqia sediminis TaxID=2986998 RepID=A0AA41Y8U4_9BACT|nr:DEAD/DEAH box helicase [Gaoshiqia sediminis]MCW0483716.1 DEAD/DEAH box helicase [Gaoshiqia sediminis]
MTEEQKKWFDKLYQKRQNTATTLMDDFAISNMWNSVIEKYSDQAHFIYELLQNANDAKATKSSFQLTKNGLYFKHNGTKNFWVSNPDNEKLDQQNNKLGDINAITAVARSNKKDHSTIGKFGVGFKAVFQYTETPHIYDPNFQFKISKFIVPIKLDNDLTDRQNNETVFYFPFDKQETDENGNLKMPKEKAYSDIIDKLKKLVFPTLFLSDLQEVKWQAENNEVGEYTKKGTKQKQAEDIIYERVELNQQVGLKQIKENLFLFTRLTEEHNLNYSIGYFLDENGKLIPKQYSAFCFFPTKEITNLNFILHAPFLLTDSREGIHRSKEHNTKMVELLAQLSADSLLILKDLKAISDDIIEIIPYKNIEYGNDGFFDDFYFKIKENLQTEEILPAKNETFANKRNAYWADSPDLANLFSNEQLAELVKNQNAKWVFVTIGRTKDKEITDYIDGGSERSWDRKEPQLIKSNMDFENKIADLITSNFIKTQSNDWLHKFYEYLSERKSYQDKFKTKPIFKDSQGNAVAAFDKIGGELHGILFLPLDEANSTYKTIDLELLKNKKTKEFIENFGIKKPSLKDEIYNNILPLYEKDGEIDTETHFKKFFTYWKNAGRPEEFISLIEDKEFVSYKTNEDETTYRGIANEIYYPTTDLVKYFESKPDTKFVDLDDYYSFITEEKEQQILKEFLLKLGVSLLPRIFEKEITDASIKAKLNLRESTYGYNDRNTTTDRIIDGCNEITKNIDNEKSLILWRYLKKLSSYEYSQGSHKYFYYSQQYQSFESNALTLLKKRKWLLADSGEFVAPSEICINELSNGYDSNSELERLLGFKPSVVLTETERIASKFESEEEAEEARKALEEKREKEKRKAERKTSGTNTSVDSEDLEGAIESLENLSESVSKPKSEKEKTNTLPDFDEDEELAKGIEDFKKQLEIKKSRVDLAENINNSVKYSYDWFKAYLQLLTTYGEKQDTQKQKSISFQEIKPYKADNKYFLLCGASSYISPEIENADDFKVSLVFGNGNRENITVEGVSKKGQDLLIYCREPLSGNTLSRFSNIFKVEINFTPVIDLLDRLYKAFTNDNYIDEWETIQEAIPSLNFIYGPPGTGKTTTLCNNINDILAENPNTKFLVLTPTNKAADVVCKKLQDINPNIYAVRLSRPTDPQLEESGIYVDTLDNKSLHNINVVTSTIHRFPYFEINGEKDGEIFEYKLFKHRNFDYVIFDEASMTGLHYITFAIMALFKTNPNTNFIVAGDPKQIPPVIEIDEKELENFDFQDENIYKMMNLESFNPEEQIIREIDTIQNLDKQYRSIPQIGQLFSELSYSSLLKHDRETNRKESKQLPEKFKKLISSNVTFVDIPLNQDNSIFKVNKLFYSSYHTYCAILVSEIIRYFDEINENEQWTIGLIAPYKAQAILLNKLITSYGISENVKVFSDTVHGFQGDECDIVFFVCNPNNYFYSGHEKALLSKEYIYNVAISRAKDYLIVLHPYTAISNPFINKIGHSYKNNFGNTKILNTNDIEQILFNDRNYIETNSYISGHDNVNVFGLSEMKYFIKANDTAIDIQLRDLKEHKTNDLTVERNNINQNGGLKIVGKIDLSKFEKHKK